MRLSKEAENLQGHHVYEVPLEPAVDFEGQRYQDIVRGSRRFFQYQYALRIIGEDYFGLDVELPALEIRYRIERALDGGALVEGRELTYLLPAESVRVLALVPATVTDIRELPGETFGDVEGRLFRANATGILATVLAGLAGIGLNADLLTGSGTTQNALAFRFHSLA